MRDIYIFKMKLFYIISIFSIFTIVQVQCTCNTTAKTTVMKLNDDLLGDYTGPVGKKKPTSISVTLIVKSVTPLRQERLLQKIDVNSLVLITWVDPCLKWDPKQYEGVSVTYLNTDKIWAPQIETIQRGVSVKLLESIKCVIRARGLVACPIQVAAEAKCSRINTKYWPWDKIECSFRFEDMVHGNKSVNFARSRFPVFDSRFFKNNNYRLDKTEATSTQTPVQDEYFTSLKYRFYFSRTGAMNVAATKILSSITLAVLNLAIPAISPLEKERLILCYMSIINHILNTYDFNYHMPFPDNPPFICHINLVSFVLAVIILFCTMSIRSMLSSIKIMPPMWLIGVTRFIYNSLGQYLKFNKNMDLEGYTNLKEVTKEECTDRLIIYQVIDRIYIVLALTVYFILSIIYFCMYLSA